MKAEYLAQFQQHEEGEVRHLTMNDVNQTHTWDGRIVSLPKPYYDEDGITIYHADSWDIVPQLEMVDIVMMDPPYGMKWKSAHLGPIHGDDAFDTPMLTLLMRKARAAVYTFCRWDNLKEMPQPKSVIAWAKNNWTAGDLKHAYGRQWEACVFYPQQEHEWAGKRPHDVESWPIIPATRRLHPTEKPLGLIEKLLSDSCGDLILDPYMGSGTTLVAARRLGRRVIGIEIEERYCETAVERLVKEATIQL
ncbi:MAG: site-specific DNA-methyltransferase [bacterium]|nr:site-specific DNA-methyltransferase [bacterium]